MTDLGQSDIGDDDGVQGAGGAAGSNRGVTTGVVSVLGVGIAALLPGHGALGDVDIGLGGCTGGLAAEVEASETEGARHDAEEDLDNIQLKCQYVMGDAEIGGGWGGGRGWSYVELGIPLSSLLQDLVALGRAHEAAAGHAGGHAGGVDGEHCE